MTKPGYSDFTINRNDAARSNDSAPTLRGKIVVLDAQGRQHSFSHVGFGPRVNEGGNTFYGMQITPDDPEFAAMQAQMSNGNVATPVPANAWDGFDPAKNRIGSGIINPTSDEDRAKAAAVDPKKVRTFFGRAVVLLPTGPVAIDLVTFNRGTFHSGMANHHDPVKAAAARVAKAQGGAANVNADTGEGRPGAAGRPGAVAAPQVA